ncbi:IS3 element transposase [Escherichia coli]|nr:IS3 element transposase [Escherichia coli]
MKYVFIEKHQAEFSIKAMCRVLRVARSGWYTWCQRRTRISTRQQLRIFMKGDHSITSIEIG